MRLPRYYQKLRNLCRGWGGDFVVLPEAEFGALEKDGRRVSGWSGCPFNKAMGIDWTNRQLYCCLAMKSEQPLAGEIIHEMGHLFADKRPPNRADEWEWFGWEYAVGRHIRLPWKDWVFASRDYAIGNDLRAAFDTDEFGMLGTQFQKQLVAERLSVAKAAGLVGQDGTPLAVR